MSTQYSPQSQALEFAHHLVQQGSRDRARAVLVDLLRRDPDWAEAWLLLAQVVPTREEAAFCLREVLRIDPGNRSAARYLSAIEPTLNSAPINPLWKYPGAAGGSPAAYHAAPARRPSVPWGWALIGGVSLMCLIVVIGLIALGGSPGQQIAALLSGEAATQPAGGFKPTLTPTFTQTLPVKGPATSTPAAVLPATNTPTPVPTHTPLPTWTQLPTSTPRPTDLPSPTSAPPTSSTTDIDVTYNTEYYTFGGSTTADIQNAINTQGPIDNNGERAIALTSSNIGVSWRMAQSASGCQISSAEVNLDVTFLYPQWQPETSPDPSLLAEWDRFIRHVQEHEEHHAEISLECSQDLLDQIRALPPTGSCPTLEANVRALNDQITADCNARQQAFDDVEGTASFPLP